MYFGVCFGARRGFVFCMGDVCSQDILRFGLGYFGGARYVGDKGFVSNICPLKNRLATGTTGPARSLIAVCAVGPWDGWVCPWDNCPAMRRQKHVYVFRISRLFFSPLTPIGRPKAGTL